MLLLGDGPEACHVLSGVYHVFLAVRHEDCLELSGVALRLASQLRELGRHDDAAKTCRQVSDILERQQLTFNCNVLLHHAINRRYRHSTSILNCAALLPMSLLDYKPYQLTKNVSIGVRLQTAAML